VTAAFTIDDPTSILVFSPDAFWLASDSTAPLQSLSWIQEADGTWKVDVSPLLDS